MMPRMARVVVEGVPYHVTQRGSGARRVFFSELDFRLYLRLLRHYAQKHELSVWAYCLMPNHVHLVCVPGRPDSLSRALGRTHADYARHINIRQQGCGHLWQARFFSCPLDGAHLWRAMVYVERNPVRAGICGQAWDYRWSSAAVHCGLADSDRLLDLGPWSEIYDTLRWPEVLRTSVEEEAMAERIRQATRTGRPLGSEQFLEELEEITGRRLRPQAPGRPKKPGREELGCSAGSVVQPCLNFGE